MTLTLAIPAPRKPRRSAAALDTSRRRPATFGPLSLTRRTTDRWFVRFVTVILVPSGNLRWAAVRAFISKGSPLVVALPCNSSPYQLARPTSWRTSDTGAWRGGPAAAGDVTGEHGMGATAARGRAPGLAESATTTATAQPITRFLARPPIP